MKACPFCTRDVQDAALLCQHCNHDLTATTAGAAHPRRSWGLPAMAAGGVGVFAIVLFGSALLRTDATQRPVAAAALPPITLTKVKESLPPNSWTAVPVRLPYAGTLRLNVDVERGNPVNVFLITGDELRAFQADDEDMPRVDQGFQGVNTKTFRQEGLLASGEYYVLVQEPTARALASSTGSDVAVQVQLRP